MSWFHVHVLCISKLYESMIDETVVHLVPCIQHSQPMLLQQLSGQVLTFSATLDVLSYMFILLLVSALNITGIVQQIRENRGFCGKSMQLGTDVPGLDIGYVLADPHAFLHCWASSGHSNSFMLACRASGFHFGVKHVSYFFR